MNAPKKRGRPRFKPTATMRRVVEQMKACGDGEETIARAIGCNRDTLRLHFVEELKNGSAKKRREVVDMIFKGAKKGNAALIRRLEEMTRAAGALDGFDKPETGDKTPARPATRARQGKKEIQREEAMTAGVNSEWGEDLNPLPGTKPN